MILLLAEEMHPSFQEAKKVIGSRGLGYESSY